jgi:CubicO group peptidase (beta-lactamase class C family)
MRKCRWSLITPSAWTILILTSLAAPAHAQKSKDDSLDLYIKNVMKDRGIPGMQLAVIRHGKLEKLTHYGLASIQDSLPVNDQTIFSINSITKAFVGVAVMQLVEEGKLELNAPISRYLDSLPVAWRPVTIRQLMSHISGLPNMMAGDKMIREGEEDTAWKEIIAQPMDSKPGTRFSYCQTNYLLIGKVIERLGKKPYMQFIKDRQLAMAGMSLTRWGDGHEILPHSARGYTFLHVVDGHMARTRTLGNVFEEFPLDLQTASGMNSNALEMSRWLIALQSGSLLRKKSSIDSLWATGILNDGSHQGFGGFFNGYGVGWPMIIRPSHRALAPIGGGRAALFVYPDDNLTIVVLTNLQACNPEGFIDEIAGYYIPEMHSYNGFGFGPSVIKLNALLRKIGFEQALGTVNDWKKRDSTFHYFEENMNNWGYALMAHHEIKEALSIFKMIVALSPASWNAYDSYGEALLKNGDKAEVVKMYRKSVELNPANENGKMVLDGLLQGGGK